MGNRIEKRLYHLDGSGSVIRQSATHYVRDAQGNPLAVYNLLGGDTLVVNEFNLYGSNRLGMLTTADTLVCATCTTATAPSVYLSPVGNKRYELSNHLGNVMTVISDKPVPIDTTSDGLWDYFNASMVSATDYYPFGMGMPGRNYTSNSYKYGAFGYEKDDEVNGNEDIYTTEARPYDPRLIRWWTPDPLFKLQPGWSTYKAFLCNPILFTDPEGETEYITIITKNQKTGETKIETMKANRVMTDGVKHMRGPSNAWHYENDYYDYATTTLRTVGADGKVTQSSASTILYDKYKDSDNVWFGGDEAGDTKPDSWLEEYNDLTDFGGLLIYGSASSSKDSPGTKTKGKVWGSFDFGEFSEYMGLVNTSISSKVENTIESEFSGTKLAELMDKTKEVVEYNKNQKGASQSTSGVTYTCPTCNSDFPAYDTAGHNESLGRESGPFLSFPKDK